MLTCSAVGLDVRILVDTAPQITIKPHQSEQTWQITADGEQLSINGQAAKNNILHLPASKQSIIEIGKKQYRGGVILRSWRGQVQAINTVDLDQYVQGVIAAEMPASWPAEALAAQAIIARTYVVSKMNAAAPYDTCASESCQVYGGIAAEHPRGNAAVERTAGQIVVYRGKPAYTFFSSHSGGWTASALEVWNMKGLPYLPAQLDPFSQDGPKKEWLLRVPLSRVQEIAQKMGISVGKLQQIEMLQTTDSGRPQEILFVGDKGQAILSGHRASRFIRSLGAGSSRVTLTGLDPLIVSGAGQGHGVGLSQYGALGMARQGQNFSQILQFYYPGTNLSSLQPQKKALTLQPLWIREWL